MSRTATTLKFKMCLLLDEACSWAEKLLTDINLPPLMPDEHNNFGGSLVWILENDDVKCNLSIGDTADWKLKRYSELDKKGLKFSYLPFLGFKDEKVDLEYRS